MQDMHAYYENKKFTTDNAYYRIEIYYEKNNECYRLLIGHISNTTYVVYMCICVSKGG